MADFYAILTKALESRDAPSGEERRKVYERARSALINQLQAIDPPLPPEEITRQRLALEEAIRKIESEAAFAALEATRPTALQELDDILSGDRSAKGTESAPSAQSPPPSDKPAVKKSETEVAAAEPGQQTQTEPKQKAETSPPAGEPRLPAIAPDERIGDLGQSPDEPNLAAAEAIVPDSATSKPGEPDVSSGSPVGAAGDRRSAPPDHARATGGKSNLGLILGIVAVLLIALGAAAAWVQKDALLALFDGEAPQRAAVTQDPKPTPAEAPEDKKATDRLQPSDGGEVQKVQTTTITPDKPEGTLPVAEAPEQPAESPAQEQAPEPAPESSTETAAKTPEQPAEEQPQAAPEDTTKESATAATSVLVSQTAILYEEGENADAEAFSTEGVVNWSLDTSGSDPVVNAAIELPGRSLSAVVRISKNRDSSLPASHLIEFTFLWPNDFAGKSIRGVAGTILKTDEQVQGDPLIGATAEVGGGVFWQALSATEAEKVKNISLIRDRGWFDIPILYETGLRAIITFEKGTPGTKIFDEALAAWGD